MSKFLVFYGSLFFTFIYFSTAAVPYKCIHESVVSKTPPRGKIPASEARKQRRDTHESKYEPLTIHTHMDELDLSVPENVLFSVDYALKQVEEYLAKTLNVLRSVNPFLIERSACIKKWKSGPNKGKCSQMRENPTEESCYLHSTKYIIPDRFLNVLKTFNYDDERPSRELEKGQGVPDVNFILFVIMRTSVWCKESGVQAYGSNCRLNFEKRPVAGLINLCPEYFAKRLYKHSHYYNVIMHEMMHVLGFSSLLYPKFKPCPEKDINCHAPKTFMKIDKHGIPRLMFPQIVQNMQDHFDCLDEDFGGPLESNLSKTGGASHWHPLLMYTSIMTSSILEDDYVVVDNITLALLASTGWYEVNFQQADPFHFGKNGGCDFGYNKSCETFRHLCTPGNSTSVSKGCDVLQYTVGKCKSVIPSHQCGTYEPDHDEKCLDEQDKHFGVNIRSFYHEKRCVTLQNLTDETREPSCMVVRCKKLTGLEVHVNSTWISCPLSETVLLNNTRIECPDVPSICPSTDEKEAKKRFCTRKENFALSVRMYFSAPELSLISNYSFIKNFKAYTINEIAKAMNIPVNYIVNSTIFLLQVMYLEFDICPPKSMSYKDLSLLIKKVQKFLKKSSFTYVFPGIQNVAVATKQHMVDPIVAVAFSDYEGFRMLTIVPVICAIFVLATFVASLSRYVIIQRHRPKRQTVEMENLEQSNVKTQFSNEPLDSNINLLKNL